MPKQHKRRQPGLLTAVPKTVELICVHLGQLGVFFSREGRKLNKASHRSDERFVLYLNFCSTDFVITSVQGCLNCSDGPEGSRRFWISQHDHSSGLEIVLFPCPFVPSVQSR